MYIGFNTNVLLQLLKRDIFKKRNTTKEYGVVAIGDNVDKLSRAKSRNSECSVNNRHLKKIPYLF